MLIYPFHDSLIIFVKQEGTNFETSCIYFELTGKINNKTITLP